MVNTSSAQGAQFAEACEAMTRTVRELGPSPLRKKAGRLDSESAGQQQQESQTDPSGSPAAQPTSGTAA